MIHANRIVTVGEQESIIDRPIVLYRGDREVEIEFTLVGNEFTFSEEGNVIKSVNASHGQLVLNTPSGEHMFSELAECHEGKVVFVVTKEMIDEFIEMGFYSFQIRLYDSAEMKSRVTIPPVMNGFDIRNPIAAEDETNVVDQGIVDYARIFKDQSNEELPTFTWDGEYVKTEWVHHDVITENKMNKIEDALYSINANIKESDVIMLNTLDQVKKDADKYVKEHMAEVEADVEEFERNLNTGVEQFKIDTNAAMTAHKNEVSEVVDGFSGEIESINSQLSYIAKNIEVSVTDFGAKGDGVTDDTEAFKKANEYIWSMAYDIYTPNLVQDRNIKLIIPNGVYKITGDKVLGSVRDESEIIDVKSVGYIVEGNGSTLLWNISNENDRLFYLDYTVTAPKISNLRIFTINETKVDSSGIIFSIESIQDDEGAWRANCSNGRYISISTCSGRNSKGQGNRCKHVFKIVGENMCDQSLVENCGFTYFKNCFYCENSQSVNWTFIRSSFFGSYTDSVYFDFVQMNDNFNVHMCSFSLHDGQTILQCLSETYSSGKLIERPDYNFSFVDNRMEIYHSGDYDYINVCKMNFGRMYMARSNFRLAGGSGYVRQKFLVSGHGSYVLDTCDLNNPLFTIGRIGDNITSIGNIDYIGANIRDCLYSNNYEIEILDEDFNALDTTKYLLNDVPIKVMMVSNLRKINHMTFTDFIISKTMRTTTQTNQKEWSFYPTKGDISMGYNIQLPPFSTVTNIELTNATTMPAKYKTIRVYFGDKSENIYVDTENIKPDSVRKTKLTLFDGFATILDNDISKQTIYIEFVDTDGNTSNMGGTVKVTVMPLNVRFLGSIESGIHVRENKTDKEICIGRTSERPITPYAGQCWFDANLNKPVWFNGSVWKDASGTTV